MGTEGKRLLPGQGWVLALTSVASFMVSLDTQVVATALPVIRVQLHASLAALEWTVNAYTLSFAVLVCYARREESYVGRRLLMCCCAGDEGFVALRRRSSGNGVKPPHGALAEDCCAERWGKGVVRGVRWGTGRRTQVNR